jgi:hypothetical protein
MFHIQVQKRTNDDTFSLDKILNREQRINGGHLRKLHDKKKIMCSVENVYKLAYSRKGLLIICAV